MIPRSLTLAADAVLRPLGFIRKKATWNRRSGVLVDVVNLQQAKSGDVLFVNAGVTHQRAYVLCWNEPMPDFVDEASCTVRLRQNDPSTLIRDASIGFGDDNAPQRLIVELETRVVPFIERMHNIDQMETQLRSQWSRARDYPPTSIYLAALLSERGDQNGACSVLAELASRNLPAWRQRIMNAQELLGCC